MNSAIQPGQIPCPSCQAPLALPIEAVLAGQPIVCQGCGLELTTEREASRDALEALGRWHAETRAAREAASSVSGSDGAAEGRRRGRRPRR
ncbi:MAG: hypothetical protein PVG82_03530 [Chromatiales bacterium]|jgi:hypothetical protein